MLLRGGPRLSGEPGLARSLGRLELRDLVLDRGVESLALGELALDGGALGSALSDDLHLVGLRLDEGLLPRLHLVSVLLHLGRDPRVLVGNPVGRVDPLDQVAEARGAEDDRQGVRLVGRVERDEARRDLGARLHEVLLRRLEAGLVDLEVVLDLVEADVRGVVGLHRLLHLRVHRLDLREHLLGFCALRADLRGLGGARRGDGESKNERG